MSEIARESSSGESQTSENYGQVEAGKAAEYLRVAQQVAVDVEKLLSQEDVMPLNKRQCKLLYTKFTNTLKEVEQQACAFSNNLSHDLLIKEFAMAAERLKIFVEDWCDKDQIIAAIKVADSDERFLKQYTEMEWCSFLMNLVENSPPKRWIYEFGKFDWEERRKLSRADSVISEAAREDRNEIIEMLSRFAETTQGSRGENYRRVCQVLRTRFAREKMSVADTDRQSGLNVVDMVQIVDVRYLGRGGYGIVMEVTWRDRVFAVKKFEEADDRDNFDREAATLDRMRHPNILNMICSYDERPLAYRRHCLRIMTERMEMDLKIFLHVAKAESPNLVPFTPLEAVNIILQVAEGMLYLHKAGIQHRDLKPTNIVINRKPVLQVKVCDFGVAKWKDNTHTTNVTPNVGTTKYRAPELMVFPRGNWNTSRLWSMITRMNTNEQSANQELPRASYFRADVYSFALTCSEVLTGHEVYNGIDRMADVKREIQQGTRPPLPSSCPERLSILLKKCWDPNPRIRPDFSEICEELRFLKAILLTGALEAEK